MLKSEEIECSVSAAALAERLGVSARTILNWVKRAQIPVEFRLGKVIRFDLSEVERVLGLSK